MRGLMRRLAGASLGVLLGAGTFVLAQAPSSPVVCVVSGHITSGTTPLPGVSLIALRDEKVVAATATDPAGAYRLRIHPGDYRVTADLPAFATVEHRVSLGDASSAQTGTQCAS